MAQNGPGISNFVTGMAAAYWAHSPVVALNPEVTNIFNPTFEKCFKWDPKHRRKKERRGQYLVPFGKCERTDEKLELRNVNLLILKTLKFRESCYLHSNFGQPPKH